LDLRRAIVCTAVLLNYITSLTIYM
jgi:hypothetical protein